MLAVVLAGCGRSELSPSDLYPLAKGGDGGDAGASGKATGGSAGRAGATSAAAGASARAGAGGAVSSGGAGAQAGEPSDGGVGGEPVVDCEDGSLAITRVTPRNAALGYAAKSPVQVRFDCPFDEALAGSDHARLYGQLRGFIEADFPARRPPRELWLAPKQPDYFAGERVTAWVGAGLGGPYLWQYTADVSSASPGQFRPGTQLLSQLSDARKLALGDLDGDGDLDLLAQVRPAATVLLLNRGTGTFDDPRDLPLAGTPVLGDVDRDGDLDVLGDGPLLLNNGDGSFEPGPTVNNCVAAGDLDGDGDLDCVSSTGYRNNGTTLGSASFNDGAGNFSQGPEAGFGFECELGDLDTDADLDVVCVSPVVDAARVFLNDGRGTFSGTRQMLGAVGARGMALGDVDGDYDLDVVLSIWHGGGKHSPNEIWLNDGRAAFEQSGTAGANGGDVELADLDGDGALDLVYSHLTPYGPSHGPFNSARIYWGNGKGKFVDSGRTLGDPAFHWFAVGDLDGDRDLDAFVFHQLGVQGNYSAVWFNEN